jgi:hypothetical protein
MNRLDPAIFRLDLLARLDLAGIFRLSNEFMDFGFYNEATE